MVNESNEDRAKQGKIVVNRKVDSIFVREIFAFCLSFILFSAFLRGIITYSKHTFMNTHTCYLYIMNVALVYIYRLTHKQKCVSIWKRDIIFCLHLLVVD